jgi:hypothetical protein
MKEILTDGLKEHLHTWRCLMVKNCGVPDANDLLKKAFEEFNATATGGVNFPCNQKLLQLYPHAKFVDTQRTDAILWHGSILHTSCTMFPNPLHEVSGARVAPLPS